jgi:hypothetical protein
MSATTKAEERCETPVVGPEADAKIPNRKVCVCRGLRWKPYPRQQALEGLFGFHVRECDACDLQWAIIGEDSLAWGMK